jgi:pSer/pThr/pTyr-binding forkhead associated (FHA) protein
LHLTNELTFPPGRVIVGRSPDNEVFIKSKFVSRHHAQLITDEEGCMIEDLNSTNGVFLGERQVKKYRLRNGDVVSLGVHELVYHDLRQDQELIDDQLEDTIDDQLDDDDDQDSAVNQT